MNLFFLVLLKISVGISNKPYTNTGIENNRNIGGMRYEDQ